MTAWLKKVRGYLLAVVVGMASILVVLALLPAGVRALFIQGSGPVGGAGILAVLLSRFWSPKKKEKTDDQKTEAGIMAGDPRDSLDRLPDDLRAKVDAGAKSDVDAQVDAVFKRHARDGGADPGGAGGGAAGG